VGKVLFCNYSLLIKTLKSEARHYKFPWWSFRLSTRDMGQRDCGCEKSSGMYGNEANHNIYGLAYSGPGGSAKFCITTDQVWSLKLLDKYRSISFLVYHFLDFIAVT